MALYSRTHRPPHYISSAVQKKTDRPVVGNLAVTPKQMYEMAQKGIPISTGNIEMQPKEGEANPSWDIPLDMVRGVDPATLWEHRETLRMKAIHAHKRDVKKFGVNAISPSDSKDK